MTSRTAFCFCVGLIMVFALLSWFGVRGKNATYDEVLHVPAAWVHAGYQDFRIDPEDPPLWKYWSALPHWTAPPRINMDSPGWHAMPQDPMAQWRWCVETLYRTPGNHADQMVNQSRFMMLGAGLALGLVLAYWAWQIGGPVAAVAATFLFAFDPNFLGHAPLVKNDVSLTLVLFALTFTLWHLGLKTTAMKVILAALLCGSALCVKFSGLIVLPLALLLLLVRSLLASPWLFFGRRLTGPGLKFLAASSLCTVLIFVTVLVVWACYGFRYHATPNPDLRLNTPHLFKLTAINEILASHPEQPLMEEELDRWRPRGLVQGILFAGSRHLLPEAWLHGLLYTHMTTRLQNSFLCGEYSSLGWWYYFPSAILFKTPATTLLGAALSFLVIIFCRNRKTTSKYPMTLWTAVCLALPFGLYGAFIVKSNVNLGLRHAFPVYPFLFLWIAYACARAVARWHKKAGFVTALLAAGLIAESAASFPDYLSFFNPISGGSGRGIHLLGDSNLDWGQDLKRLARWREKNREQKLYLCYFGMADPAYYGIDYINLPGGYRFGPEAKWPDGEGVIAISATHLQGIHLTPALRQAYVRLRHSRPRAVLGGSIYLFDSTPLAKPPGA